MTSRGSTSDPASPWRQRFLAAAALQPLVGLLLVTGVGPNKSLFYVVCLAALVLLARTPRGRQALRAPDALAVTGVTLAVGVSFSWSPAFAWLDMLKVFGAAASIAGFVILWSGSWLLSGTAFERVSRYSLIACGLMAVALAGLEYVSVDAVTTREHFGRLLGYGQLRNPVVAGVTFGVLALIAVAGPHEQARGVTLASAAAALVLGIACVATGTRTALLAFAVGILWLVRSRHVVSALVLVAAGLAVASLLWEGARDVFLRVPVRQNIWWGTLGLMEGWDWVTGHGLRAPFPLSIDGVTIRHPHSLYFSTLYYCGVPGLLLFTSLSVRWVWLARRAPPHIGAPVVYALTVIVLDGNELVADINFLWLILWYPVAHLIGWRLSASTPSGPRSTGGG